MDDDNDDATAPEQVQWLVWIVTRNHPLSITAADWRRGGDAYLFFTDPEKPDATTVAVVLAAQTAAIARAGLAN